MKKNINVDKLIVNPENYRFDPVDTQDEAINLMIETKGMEIVKLAEHILQNGLDEAKDIRVLEQEGYYIVLDGNRRITAVKCLLNPSLIKMEKWKKEFEKLPTLFRKDPPTEVSCKVYPNEKSASEWIRLDHTGKNDGAGQDPWGAPEKDRFSYKFGDKLSPAMQILSLLEAKGYSFDNSKLKITTINRILSYPSSRVFLGIDKKNGIIQIISNEEESITRLVALYNTIIDKDVKVATVYDKEKSLLFMKELFGEPLDSKEKQLQISNNPDNKKGSKTIEIPKNPSVSPSKISTTKDVTKTNNTPEANYEPRMFVITAFAGLDNVYDTIEKAASSSFKQMKVFRIDYSSGAKETQDQKITKALETSDFLIVVLSMGEKERMAYEAIKKSENANEILQKYFPINHNVLLEFGYGLKCVKGTWKEKDILIIIEDIEDNGLPNLINFCRNNFFDIRNRDQIAYKTIQELEEKLEQAFKRCESMEKYLQ